MQIKFNSYSKEYNFLSNFYEKKDLVFLKYNKKLIYFNSLESAFQAVKILYVNDHDLFSNNDDKYNLLIEFSSLSPLQAKRKGKTIKNINIEKWNNDRLFIMTELIKRKFSNKYLNELLLSTKLFELIEYNTGTEFWGVVDKNGILIGENHLGKILMNFRDS